MSFFQNPNFYLQTAESDIVNFFKKAEDEVTVLEQDFLNVLSWVQQNASEIASVVAGLLGIAAVIPGAGPIPAALIAAQTLLTQGINAVNSAVAAAQAQQASGGSVNAQTVAALSAGYSTIKQAQSAAATVAATMTAPAAKSS